MSSQHLLSSSIVHKADSSLTDISNKTLIQKWGISKISSSGANNFSIIQKNVDLSKLQSSQNLSRVNYHNRLKHSEVQSIVFDSKVQESSFNKYVQQLTLTLSGDNRLNSFRQKVTKVNMGIEAGIDNVQRMIRQLILTKDKIMQQRQNKAVERLSKQAIKENQDNANSKIDLMSQSKQVSKFPIQYTTFINRLSTQIQADMQFTNMVAQLTSQGLIQSIKNIIFNQFHLLQTNGLIQTFFTMQPSQIDPLQRKSQIVTKPSLEQLREKVRILVELLLEANTHFDNKLRHSFSESIIQLLFQQLSKTNSGKESITVGQLISYINIKTSSSYRNRFFVKIMKRLKLKGNGNIDFGSLLLFVGPTP